MPLLKKQWGKEKCKIQNAKCKIPDAGALINLPLGEGTPVRTLGRMREGVQ